MAASKQFGQKFDSISDLKAFKDAYVSMKNEYVKGAQEIMKALTISGTSNSKAVSGIGELKKQLKELEAQRKKAILTGDDELVDTLTKQINTVKQNIGYLDPNALKTTKTEKTEIQKNEEQIKKLSLEYAKLGDVETEASRKRQEEIQKEIELLKQRNGMLGLREAQAQGRLTVGAGDFQRTNLGNFSESMSPFAADNERMKGHSSLGLTLDDKTMKKVQEALEKGIKGVNLTKEIGNISSGVGQVFGSLEQLGIELPEGLTAVVGGMQSVISLLTGITTIITAIEAIAGADAIIPFAGGGIIKAAGGTIVGNSYSGDNLRGIGPGGQLYGLNAGEVVLNRAESGIIASALDGAGSGFKNGTIVGVLEGEKIKLVLNRHYQRIGEGEVMTWRNG